MKSSFLIFYSVLSLLILLSAYYIGNRALAKVPELKDYTKTLWFSLFLIASVQVAGPLLYRVLPKGNQLSFIANYVGYTFMGVFSCLLVYTLASDLLVYLTRFLGPKDINLARRSFFGVTGLTAVTAVVGAYQAVTGPRVRRHKIVIDNLPTEFEGYKILQISDLHVGPTIGKAYAERVRDICSNENPDFVALTGDLLDGMRDQISENLKPISEIKNRDGLLFVSGNHEYYWNYSEWQSQFDIWGFETIHNTHKTIVRGDANLVIGGIPDPQGGSIAGEAHIPNIGKAFDGAPDGPRVLLSHRPNFFEEASKEGVDLMLSGHTHGGQYYPWKFFVALAYKYYIGLNKHKDMQIYVSRGTGYWGPPNRFLVSSEVTVLTLTKS